VTDWWRDAVIYQVYLKSFADSDGDGVGDLDGLTDRLDHLVRLGVDGLWLNPCYPSPGKDGGYDVADYFRIDDSYGGTPAFERLLAAAHGHGLRVLLDVVPNHCSGEHPWFQAALADRAARDRFLFRDGRDGGPPNNWQSVFGGPAWTQVADGQWYLHSFDSSQPDFNWRNPDVRRHFEDMLRFWFDRGVDGFRIDVASMLIKADGLPDYDADVDPVPPNSNRPEVHDVYRSWRRLAEGYAGRSFVGEVWAPAAHDVAAYARGDELHQVFYFDLMLQPWHAGSFRTSVETGLDAVTAVVGPDGGTLAWALNSHDAHRSVSRYGLLASAEDGTGAVMGPTLRQRGEVDVLIGQSRARAALLFLLGLPGGKFLYQGEELGLPEVMDLPDAVRQDPIWFRSGGTDYGRDGCRVPLPWAAGAPNLGFSTGTPWLPQPDWFAGYSADKQEADPGSMLALYRAALGLRRERFDASGVAGSSMIEWLDVDRDDVIAYRRGGTVVVTVFGGDPWPLPADWGQIVLSTVDVTDGWLAGPGSAWLGQPTRLRDSRSHR
jgi:alpha-glucosidase